MTYSIHPGYLLFFENTIMENTADLAMVQKTIIDTLHKEFKSQRVITEREGCSRSAVSKHFKCKVDWIGKGNLVGKGAQATEMTASLRILSSKADSNTWESFTRSELKLESVHQESPAQTSSGKGLPSHFWNRDNVRSILPGLRRKRTGVSFINIAYTQNGHIICASNFPRTYPDL